MFPALVSPSMRTRPAPVQMPVMGARFHVRLVHSGAATANRRSAARASCIIGWNHGVGLLPRGEEARIRLTCPIDLPEPRIDPASLILRGKRGFAQRLEVRQHLPWPPHLREQPAKPPAEADIDDLPPRIADGPPFRLLEQAQGNCQQQRGASSMRPSRMRSEVSSVSSAASAAERAAGSPNASLVIRCTRTSPTRPSRTAVAPPASPASPRQSRPAPWPSSRSPPAR